jgi:carbon-monoxide dehydrogenase small subunit
VVDGRAVSGCLTFAALIDGSDVNTIEGLDENGRLHPVQEAFIEAGAFQCGYCTPGFILMVKQLLEEHPEPDREQVAHYLSGNLCRCGSYPEILEAVELAAAKMRQSG